jgi:hypothetical protein
VGAGVIDDRRQLRFGVLPPPDLSENLCGSSVSLFFYSFLIVYVDLDVGLRRRPLLSLMIRLNDADAVNAYVSAGGDKDGAGAKNGLSVPKIIPPQTFTVSELAAATRNFRDECLIREGGFGRVYKGRLDGTGQVTLVFFSTVGRKVFLFLAVGVLQALLSCTKTIIGLSRTLKKKHCLHMTGGCPQMQKNICCSRSDLCRPDNCEQIRLFW